MLGGSHTRPCVMHFDAQAASEALLEANAIGATQSRQAEAAMTELTSCKAKLAHPKVVSADGMPSCRGQYLTLSSLVVQEPNADDCAPMVRRAQQLLARAVGSHVEQLKANLSEVSQTPKSSPEYLDRCINPRIQSFSFNAACVPASVRTHESTSSPGRTVISADS